MKELKELVLNVLKKILENDASSNENRIKAAELIIQILHLE